MYWGHQSACGQQGLPDTGQTKCYNNSAEITCPQPGEEFYGQDAEYVKARSYTDLGNGIVRDNVIGLECANGSYGHPRPRSAAQQEMEVTWQHALDYVALNHELGPRRLAVAEH